MMLQDLELLEKVWGTVHEWQQLYTGWKDGKFRDLKVEEMEESAGRVGKALMKLGRDIKHWPVWAWIKVSCRSVDMISDHAELCGSGKECCPGTWQRADVQHITQTGGSQLCRQVSV